ncbi:MAG: hypothetical protein Q8T09_23130 [Candidatus Melainabacteria bacterium]|nr:hypothetical protein [Candidatus Melainabacteria bacterium]
METSKSSVSKFLHLNERNLFWLFVAACLVFIANWFLATHGFFEIESERLRQLLTAVSMCSPIIGIVVLCSQNCRNEVPVVAALVFASMLLMWPTATITCFAILLFCWTTKSRIVGIAILIIVQVFAGILMLAERKNAVTTVEIAKLHTEKHNLILRGLTSDGTFCSSLALQEDYPVIKGLRLVKTFYRLKDKDYDYRKELFSLSPVDGHHAGLVIQHGPRSQQVVIDLTIKNRWSEFDENVY